MPIGIVSHMLLLLTVVARQRSEEGSVEGDVLVYRRCVKKLCAKRLIPATVFEVRHARTGVQ